MKDITWYILLATGCILTILACYFLFKTMMIRSVFNQYEELVRSFGVPS